MSATIADSLELTCEMKVDLCKPATWFEQYIESGLNYAQVKQRCADYGAAMTNQLASGYPAFFKSQEEMNTFLALPLRRREYLG